MRHNQLPIHYVLGALSHDVQQPENELTTDINLVQGL